MQASRGLVFDTGDSNQETRLGKFVNEANSASPSS